MGPICPISLISPIRQEAIFNVPAGCRRFVLARPVRRGRRSFNRLFDGRRHEIANPLNDVIKHRRQENAEQRHPEHPREHGRSQRLPHLRPGADRDHQRHHAEDERE